MTADTAKRSVFDNMSTFVRWQLAIFAVLTVVGLVVMAVVYVQVPAMLGIGRYKATVQLAASGGLYPHSNVSYRGTEIGTVTAVRLTSDGVDADMSLKSSYKIPANAIAKVRSVSAIGEQYVELDPTGPADGSYLSDGATIPQSRTELPQDVGPMLDRAERMVAGLNDTKLQQVLNDAFEAFNGTGPQLQRLLDSAHLFVQAADANLTPTKQLLEQIGPLLDTQRESSDAVRAWTANLVKVTDQLRAHDPQLRQILQQAPGVVDTTNSLFTGLRPSLPLVLANATAIGQVTETYVPGIQQLLVIFPPLVRALMTVATDSPLELGAKANFANMPVMNNPPPCLDGFLPAKQWRSADKVDAPPLPPNLYCHAPHNANIDVRGARNNPCPNDPNRRGATPEQCGLDFAYTAPTRTGGASSAGSPVPNVGPTVAPSSYHPDGDNNMYDPQTGVFIGPDGRTYSQPGVASGGSAVAPKDWQAMMIQQQGR